MQCSEAADPLFKARALPPGCTAHKACSSGVAVVKTSTCFSPISIASNALSQEHQPPVGKRLPGRFGRCAGFTCLWSVRQVIGSAGSWAKAWDEIPGTESRPGVGRSGARTTADYRARPAKRCGHRLLKGFLHMFARVPRMYLVRRLEVAPSELKFIIANQYRIENTAWQRTNHG